MFLRQGTHTIYTFIQQRPQSTAHASLPKISTLPLDLTLSTFHRNFVFDPLLFLLLSAVHAKAVMQSLFGHYEDVSDNKTVSVMQFQVTCNTLLEI